MGKCKLTAEQVAGAELRGWRFEGDALRTRIHTGDFAEALIIVNAIGAAAEELNHHPDLGLGWGRVDVELSSHDVGGVTERDLVLARRVSAIAAAAGGRIDER